jgi:hypothetical protein
MHYKWPFSIATLNYQRVLLFLAINICHLASCFLSPKSLDFTLNHAARRGLHLTRIWLCPARLDQIASGERRSPPKQPIPTRAVMVGIVINSQDHDGSCEGWNANIPLISRLWDSGTFGYAIPEDVTFQGHQHFRLASTQATAAGGGGDGVQFKDHLGQPGSKKIPWPNGLDKKWWLTMGSHGMCTMSARVLPLWMWKNSGSV